MCILNIRKGLNQVSEVKGAEIVEETKMHAINDVIHLVKVSSFYFTNE